MISAQQFGQFMQKVDDLIPKIDQHIEASDERHSDTERRIRSLEEDKRFWRKLSVIGWAIWPLLYPVVKEIVLNLIFHGGDKLESMLSYHYIINTL